MRTIVHCADLHLDASAEERDYGLAVLDEIVDVAREEKAAALLFCGDLFDSFADLEILRHEVRRRLDGLPESCFVAYVPGNHEARDARGRKAASFDLGRIGVIDGGPFTLVQRDGFEFLCIPHRESYADYGSWSVPPKKTDVRIGLAHALVTGMDVWIGPVDGTTEEPAGAMDPDLFARFGVDYAALGHIHARREKMVGGVRICYPGSARVWRRGEEGPRGVVVVSCGESLETRFRPLESAGEYRVVDIPLEPNGESRDIEALSVEWSARDWIELRLSGVVEDENAVAETERHLRRDIGSRVRRLAVNRDDVDVLEGIAGHTLARRFLDAWERGFGSSDPRERDIWIRARRIGLREIMALLERHA